MKKLHLLVYATHLFAALLTTLAGSCLLHAEEPVGGSATDQTPVFMRAKLASSQKVIEGLVTEDFDLIRRAADDMKQMSDATQWPTAQDKSYQHYREAFRQQCDRLGRLAEAKNLAGVHYTYLQLTTTCINCHDYVRGRFHVAREASNPKGPVMLIPNEWEGSDQPRRPPTKEARHVKEVGITQDL